eukprot:1518133-Lingulodinium_polyedra.AAC.1
MAECSVRPELAKCPARPATASTQKLIAQFVVQVEQKRLFWACLLFWRRRPPRFACRLGCRGRPSPKCAPA